jgi:hypothetical protein
VESAPIFLYLISRECVWAYVASSSRCVGYHAHAMSAYHSTRAYVIQELKLEAVETVAVKVIS